MSNNKHTVFSFLARAGVIGKGLVYFMVGLMALQTALGIGSQQSSTINALQEIFSKPFGFLLLVGCIIGLLAHAIWRIIQAIWNPEHFTQDGKTMFFRFVDFIVGCLYLSFSYAAWQILIGLNAANSGKPTEVWISQILELPFGKWIVLFTALVVLCIGFYQFYSAYLANFDYRFDTAEMSDNQEQTLRQMGRIGFSAWGVVYIMMAVLFYKAATHFEAKQAGGLSDALNALQQQPYGFWILSITAAGLIIYGIYLLTLSYFYQLYI